MSKENIKVVQIDTNPATKSLKDLRNELKGFKDEMANLEEGSDAFLEVANKAGEVKHQIDEINESIKGASADFGDMIGNVTNVAAGITGAFQAVAGGLQAMGVESKAIDEAIVKMQGLMAVTDGLSKIDTGIKAFDKLAASLGKTGAALKTFVTGLGKIAAPIAIITALGVAFTKLKSAIDGTNKVLKQRETAQKNFNTELEKEIEIRKRAGYEEDELINFQIAKLELRNAQLEKSNELLQAENDAVSKNAQAAQNSAAAFGGLVAAHAAYDGVAQSSNVNVGANTKLIQENTQEINDNAEAIKKLKDELEIINSARQLAASRTNREVESDVVGESVNNAYDTFRETNEKIRQEKFRLYLAELQTQLLQLKKEEELIVNRYSVDLSTINELGFAKVTDKAETDRENDFEKGIMDLANVLELKAKILVVENQIKDRIKDEIELTKTLATAANSSGDVELYRKYSLELQELNQDLINQEIHVNELEQSYAELAFSIENIRKVAADKELYEWAAGINKQFEILNHTVRLFGESSLGMSNMWGSAITDMQNMFNDLVKTVIEGGDDAWKGYAQAASIGLQAVGTMLNAASEDVDKNTKEGFEQQKKLQIGATVMNMLSGIMAAWTSSMALPAPASFILGAINTAATAALGAAQIAKIKNAKFGDNGANVSSSAVGGMIMPPVHYSSAVQGASTEGTIHNTKVYVTETDIQKTIQKVNVQESENTY